MTTHTKTTTERIREAIERRPSAPDYIIAKSLQGKIRVAEVAAVRASMAGTAKPEPSTGGPQPIQIGNRQVRPVKPQGSDAKRQLREIPRGSAYRVSDFAEKLGVSEDTLKKHARSMHCLRWVETAPDHWIECVLNPDDAKRYNA